MTNWILNIVGMVFVGVVLDALLPNGKISIFIKSIFAIFVLYVIVYPLPKIFNANLNVFNTPEIETNLNFIINTNLQKITAVENDLVLLFEDEGFENVGVMVSANIYEEEFKVKKIHVDLLNMVLKTADKHINTNDKITDIITSYININAEDIVFYV